ncbi:metalloendopeptidase [Coemansia sp. RSA 1200]|nr:metalloendopeptidase [Coemansia sp. RSA 1200]
MNALSGEDRQLVEKLAIRFAKYGSGLNNAQHAELVSLGAQINARVEKFCHNIRSTTVEMMFSQSELDGLPDSFFKNRKTIKSATTTTSNNSSSGLDGPLLKYVVTTSIIDYTPVMKLATNEETRRKMYTAYVGRCPENMQLLQETVRLRLKASRILGFSNYSELVLQDTMARSPDTVAAFLTKMEHRTSGVAQINSDGLVALKMQDMEASNKPFHGFHEWDRTYYTNKMMQTKHGVDSEVVRKYLPLQQVVDRILDIYETMLGLRLVCSKKKGGSVWHPDVELYEVWEADDELGLGFVGHLYLDLYFRDDKPTGSGSTFHIRPGFESKDAVGQPSKRSYPAAAVLVDLPKPGADTVALLSFSQVKALVHELGHAFHILCSKAKWSLLQGTGGVEQDFVEVPSLMMEHLFMQPAVLRQLASHYKTGAPMPEDLLHRVCAYEQQDGANYRELLLTARYDMAIHSTTNDQIDCCKLYEQITGRPSGLYDASIIDHLMDSYSSMYYSYLWSSVIALKMLRTRFLAEADCVGVKIGAEFRKEILQQSGTRRAQESLERFLKNTNRELKKGELMRDNYSCDDRAKKHVEQ